MKTTTGPLGEAVACACEKVDCVLLNAREHCALPESLAGYESALSVAGVRFVKASASPLPHAKTILIPACVALPTKTATEVAAALKGGSCIVLESGAGFATPKDFAAHQEWLLNVWSVKVQPRVDLWKRRNNWVGNANCRFSIDDFRLRRSKWDLSNGNRQSTIANRQFPSPAAPYLDFHWPLKVKVRDFSCVVPVSTPAEQVIGWCGDWPIASKQTLGKGALVFLGSPVGPALRAGDAEAHRWLSQVLNRAT
jgi:hypothetical protein